MANAITTFSPTATTFVVNKYDDIDGARVAQDTPRGRFCLRDASGRMVLPRDSDEAKKAVFPVDWAKPLNPGPYFLNAGGLNGTSVYPFDDGSVNGQENDFALDPDQVFQAPWPIAIGPVYDVSPLFYNKPVPSGARCLVYDEGTFTYGSGNYTGVISDYSIADRVYASDVSGSEGQLTLSGTIAVGIVVNKDVFGQNSITIKALGSSQLGL